MAVSSPIIVTGIADPDQLHYSNKSFEDDEIIRHINSGLPDNNSWPLVKHIFILKNQGPSNAKDVDFVINWPG